jgi:hypothetical protein
MPKLKIGTAAAALAMSVGLTLLPASCGTPNEGEFGFCRVDADCLNERNFQGWGSVCNDGICRCANFSDEACCPNNDDVCGKEDFACRSPYECRTCETDDECPAASHQQCGFSRCSDGRCKVKIIRDQPLPSQRLGDCTIMMCDADGRISSVSDPTDVPADGNPCTQAICGKYDYPEKVLLQDGEPCPGQDSGICFKGECVECKQTSFPTCPGNLVCVGFFCVPTSCTDSVKNDQETDIDCGGPECRYCYSGKNCLEGRDCSSGVCVGQKCQDPTHDDGVKNGPESGVDCGYSKAENTCPDGEECTLAYQCESGVCYGGICLAPTCFDGVKNGVELGVDCGRNCPPCQD